MNQQVANSNGYITFFLADQQTALQAVQSDYAQRTSGAVPFTSGQSFVSNMPPVTGSRRRRLAQATGADYAAVPSTSLSTTPGDISNSGTLSLTPVVLAINQAISIPTGSRARVRLNLQNLVGEVYLFAYYDP